MRDDGTIRAPSAGSGSERPGDVHVFINYRREDSAGHAGRLHDDLARTFTPEQIFIDVADIPVGVDFVASITDAVARCTALVALIGPRWLAAAHPDGRRRLDDPKDYVRLEIEAALERDVLVIPILLQGARMPRAADLPDSLKPLAKRNAVELRDGSWRSDFEALASGLSRAAAVAGVADLRGESEAFWRSAPADVELPYRGLRPFEEEDARFYFGREDDVDALVGRLRERRFVAVFGPSGSGKSSLVRAGLVSAIRGGALEGATAWPIEIVRPGARPLETLAARLARRNPARPIGELVDALGKDQRTLHLESMASLAAGSGAAARFLWVVDQAEELFTICRDEDQRRATIANLVHAATVSGGPAIVVLAMRADFYQRCAAYPDLAAAVSASQYLVSPMSEAGLRRAIEAPAKAVGLQFEPGLVDTIVGDVSSQPGALPLLEHALYELFQRRRGVTLTLEGYRAIGGVEGALANRAESVYDDLDESEKGVVRRVMLRLTQPGEGTVDTRRRSTLRDLPAEVGESEPVRHVVGELADARLLTVGASDEGGEPVVEIAHEALIRAWPRVRDWIEQDRAALVVHRRIADATAEWQRLGGSDEVLLRGVRLAEAREWRTQHADLLNDAERSFLEASIEEAETDARARDRRRTRLYALTAGLVAFFVVLSGAALLAWRESQTLLDRALVAESAANDTIDQLETQQAELDAQRRLAVGRSLLSAASAEGTSFNLDLLLGLEARRLAGREGNEVLVDGLARFQALTEMLQVTSPLSSAVEGDVAVVPSPELGVLGIARRTDDRTAVALHDLATGGERPLAELVAMSAMAFAPDGTLLATSGTDANGQTGAFLWPVPGGDPTFLPTGVATRSLEFSGDGSRIATEASPEGNDIVVWDVATATEIFRLDLGLLATDNASGPGARTLVAYALNADGTLLAIDLSAPEVGPRIEVWNVATGRMDRLIEPAGSGLDSGFPLTFSLTADVLAGARASVVNDEPDPRIVTTLEVWDLRGAEVRSRIVGIGGDGPVVAALAPDGTYVAAAAPGALVLEVPGSGGQAISVVSDTLPFAMTELWFSADGAALVGHDGGGTLARWAIDSTPSIPTSTRVAAGAGSALSLRAIGPDGRHGVTELLSGVNPGELERDLEILNLDTGERAPLDPADGGAVAFSADGQQLLATGGGALRIWRLQSGATWAPAGELPTRGSVAAFSPDASLVAVAAPGAEGASPRVEIWDIAARTKLGEAPLALDATALAFTPDNRRLIVATAAVEEERHTAQVFDVREPQRGSTALSAGPGVLRGLWGGGDGALFGTTDGGLMLRWDLATGMLVSTGRVPHSVQAPGATSPASLEHVALGPDGQIVGVGEGSLWLWSPEDFAAQHLDAVETRACELAGRNLSQGEWSQYLPGEPYRATCPNHPAGD